MRAHALLFSNLAKQIRSRSISSGGGGDEDDDDVDDDDDDDETEDHLDAMAGSSTLFVRVSPPTECSNEALAGGDN